LAAVVLSVSAAAVSRSTLLSHALYSSLAKTPPGSLKRKRFGSLFFQKGASWELCGGRREGKA